MVSSRNLERRWETFLTTPKNALETFVSLCVVTPVVLLAGMIGLGIAMEKGIVKDINQAVVLSGAISLGVAEVAVQSIRLVRRLSRVG